MTVAATPAEAYDRYLSFYEADALIQGNWHGRMGGDGSDGRDCACGLGVLGPDINSPGDCPREIMPLWLARMTVFFFDGQTLDDAKDWGLRFYAEIKRLNGQVPFAVVYSWHAEHTAPIAIEAAQKRGRAIEPHEALQALHRRAAAGDRAPREEWRAALRTAYAYAYADADADADADAYAYADADAYAYAYAYADAYAYAYAYADVDAYAYAYAGKRHEAIKRMADGMVACLAAFPTPDL